VFLLCEGIIALPLSESGMVDEWASVSNGGSDTDVLLESESRDPLDGVPNLEGYKL
jgi:hypothetical protein